MIVWLAKRLAASLKKQLAPETMDALFSQLPPAERVGERETVCVCALQMELKCYPSLKQWLLCLDDTLSRAAAQGSRLVCLPEFYAMMPLLCHRAVALAVKGLSLLPDGGSGESPAIAPLLEPFAFLAPAYESIICRFARRYGIWLYGGTGLSWEAGKVYNRGFLVSPEGSIAARQDKIHLTREEIALGLTPGSTLQVVPTPIGRIALSVCMDATYFESFRVAKNLGADYIIVPIGDMAEFDPWLALRGAQLRVNETGLTAVKPALISAPGFPLPFSGKAGIWFPLSTGLESKEYPNPREAGMVIRSFPLSRLRQAESALFLRKNPGFDRNYREELIKQAHLRRQENG